MKTNIIQSLGLVAPMQVFALGYTMGANGASDFSAAAGSQVFTLDQVHPGDVVIPSLSRVCIRKNIAGAAGNYKLKVGIAGTTDRFLPDVDMKSGSNYVIVPDVSGGNSLSPYVNNSGSDVDIIATLTALTGNVSAITAGELWIELAILRFNEHVRGRIGF